MIARGRRSPPPTTPTSSSGTPAFSTRPARHCCKRSMVGTTTSVRTGACSRAMKATTVLPAPVGRTTTPRPLLASQLRRASR